LTISTSFLQGRRDQIAEAYFDTLSFDPYPVQEEALLSWFTEDQGVLVCAPTGTGKTLIAEAAIYEALQLGKTAYYTTPLIALTDQKFRELQEKVISWGFFPEDVGLVTGNRKINPDAKILVVVAEILLNRLLHKEAFDFSDVWAVVMDEFHSFNDLERGIVWEFGLSLLPPTVKTLLLSATVGNSLQFTQWLHRVHQRRLKLVQSDERKVPLTYSWVSDEFLPDQIEKMVTEDDQTCLTPALIFCFNREQCWNVAELLKGKRCVGVEQQKQLAKRLEKFDWSQGAGPKLKQILIRGIGVHHAGVLPRYRRIVEELFQDKLLTVCVCTETLAAGINLPARSVVVPTLLKGPPGKMKLIEPSSAKQMFGRAGRPQFDNRGFVIALPHEDDVKILRWKEKFDSIPEDTKDPGLLKAKKDLKKKQPKRREGEQYWNKEQFEKLVTAPATDLASRGPLPWRLLVYMLDASPKVDLIRKLVAARLLEPREKELAQKQLDRQLIALWRAGFITLEPKPPLHLFGRSEKKDAAEDDPNNLRPGSMDQAETSSTSGSLTISLDLGQRSTSSKKSSPQDKSKTQATENSAVKGKGNSESASPGSRNPSLTSDSTLSDWETDYQPEFARATESMADLLLLRGVHPLYAVFLMKHLGIADQSERILAFESILELSGSLGAAVRIPKPDILPPGPLAITRLDPLLLQLGLATAEELGALKNKDNEEEEEARTFDRDEWVPLLTLPYKLHRLFQYDFPGVEDVRVSPVWVAGEMMQYGTDFNKYITSNKLQKQEGIIFRHLLRMILLLDEMAELRPADIDHDVWRGDLAEIANQLEEACRKADSESTDKWLSETRQLGI
jgi:superfamily II DNA/RNA helicase